VVATDGDVEVTNVVPPLKTSPMKVGPLAEAT
jgi:hypothetical protein